MPGRDGIATGQKLRSDLPGEYVKTVPIIALTADAIKGNEERFLGAGFQDFLTKPIDIIKLDAALNKWVRDKEREKAVTQTATAQAGTPEQAAGETAAENDEDLEAFLRDHAPDGIGVDELFTRFGSASMCFSALSSYANHIPQLLKELDYHMRDGNKAQYVITVHGIKGASYSVSAREAGGMAEELEKEGRNGNWDIVKEKHPAFISRMEKFAETLSSFVAAAGNLKPLAAKPDAGLLGKLKNAVAAYDINEADKIMDELEKFRYSSGTDLVPWLREQIDQSGFVEVKERLREYT
jgi:CheY-like chemotaxis protein